MARKLTPTQKIKRALALLDTAVQEWYAEHAPKNKDHYASAIIMDSVEDGWHASRITLNDDRGGFVDIKSSKQRYILGKEAVDGNNSIQL